MNGSITKYYKFEKSGSGRVTIPISLAKSLKWKHGDDIVILIDTKDNQTGLFLFKKEEKKGK